MKFKQARVNGGSNYDSLKVAKCPGELKYDHRNKFLVLPTEFGFPKAAQAADGRGRISQRSHGAVDLNEADDLDELEVRSIVETERGNVRGLLGASEPLGSLRGPPTASSLRSLPKAPLWQSGRL